MEHLVTIYNNLMMSYNQWWYDTLGPTGLEITQRATCVIAGLFLAWGIHEANEAWKIHKLKKSENK